MPQARTPRSLAACAVLCAATAGALCAFTSARAEAVRQPAPAVIVHTQPPYADPISLHAIDCPSASLCVAVDDAGNVLTSGGPGSVSWQVANVDGNANLTAISCASASLCVASDTAGAVAVSTAPTRGARAWHVSHVDNATNGLTAFYPSNYLTGVSCPTTGLCVAVDNRGNVITSTSPAAGALHWTTANVDGTNAFASVACASPSLCVAVDLAGNLAVSSNPVGGASSWRVEPLPGAGPGTPFPTSLGGNFASAVACPSERLCVATTSAGYAISSQQPGAGAGTWTVAPVDTLGGLNAVSCTTAAYCTAVDTQGNAFTTTNPGGGVGTWQGTLIEPSHQSISGVSCGAAGECAAVDQSGNAVTLTAGAPSWRLQPGVDEPRSPRCFGAAQPGLGRLCSGRHYAHSALPTPGEAQITPNAPCAVIERLDVAEICAFGVPAAQATATVALLGDSHAQHWRAALEVVAQASGWQGVSVTQAGCPFSAGPLSVTGNARKYCRRMMMHDVIAWLRSQPTITTVFVSESELSVPHHTGDIGEDVRGYARAWEALPASVKHVVVIRDTPRVSGSTLNCVEAALAAHRPYPGRACAVPRGVALGVDPAALAAAQVRTGRVQVVDLTPFICDRHLCYPVVGGALAYKDFQHLTEVFSATLGPFLRADIARLAAGWHE